MIVGAEKKRPQKLRKRIIIPCGIDTWFEKWWGRHKKRVATPKDNHPNLIVLYFLQNREA